MKIFFGILFLGMSMGFSGGLHGQVPTCQTRPDPQDQEKLSYMFTHLSALYNDPSLERSMPVRRSVTKFTENQLTSLGRKSLEALYFHYLLINERANPFDQNHINQICQIAKEYSAPQVSAVYSIVNDMGRERDIKFHLGALLVALKSLEGPEPDKDFVQILETALVCPKDPTTHLDQLGRAYLRFQILLMEIEGKIALESPPEKKSCCVCQVGSRPKWQRPFFKAGCSMWLNEQTGCDLSSTQEIGFVTSASDQDVTLDIPMACYGGKLKLGYVGHWDADSTEPFISRTIIPSAKYYKLSSLQYDNTACSALEEPEKMQDLIRSLSQTAPLPVDVTIEMLGNQCTSYSMWSRFFGDSPNFRCKIGTECEVPKFPSCLAYEKKACGAFQLNEKGRCLEQGGASSKNLVCCKDVHVFRDAFGVSQKVESFFWRAGEQCL